MLVRRVLRLAVFSDNEVSLNALDEGIAFVITLFLAAGLGLMWRRQPEPEPGVGPSATEPELETGRRMRREALLLGVISLGGLGLLVWFTYVELRADNDRQLARASLETAQLLNASARAEGPTDPQTMVNRLVRSWQSTRLPDDRRYLCIIGPEDRLVANTLRPSLVGEYVGDARIGGNGEGPQRTVAELRRAHGSWAGRNANTAGYPQIAGYSYVPEIDSLVVVHVPQELIIREFWRGNVLVGVGVLVVAGLGIPLSLFFFYGMARREHERATAEMRRRIVADESAKRIGRSTVGGVWALDDSGRTTFVTPVAAGMLGYAVEEMDRRPLEDFLMADDQPQAAEFLARRRQGIAEQHELRLRHKSGAEVWVQLAASPVLAAGGAHAGTHAMMTDITARRRAEAELRESRDKFAALADNSIQGIIFIHGDRIVYVNPAQCAITGYPEEEMLQRPLGDLFGNVHPEDRARAIQRQQRFEQGEQIDEVNEMRIRRKDGTWCWVRAATKSFRLQGQPARLGMMIDITEQKRAAAEIQRFATIFENAGWGMAVADPATNVLTHVNPAFAAMHGYAVKEMIGMNLADTFAPEALAELPVHVDTAHGQGRHRYVARHRRKDGSTFPCQTMVTAFKDPSGEVRFRAATVEDITERQAAEEALRKSEANYRTVVDSASDGILVADPAGRFLEVNPAGCRMLGYTREEVLGLSTFGVIVADQHERIFPEMAALRVGEVARSEWLVKRKDGSVFPCEVSATSLPDGRLLGILRDISFRRQAEAALRLSESRYRRLMEANMIGITIANTDGRVVEANDLFLDMIGYSRAELATGGVRWDAITPPEWESVDRRAVAELQDKGVCTAFEKEYFRKDGRRVPIRATVALLEGGSGDAICLIEDLTVRKKADEERRLMFERITDAFVALDRSWHYTYVNEKAGKLLGRDPTSLIGRHIWTEFPEGVGQPFHLAYEKAMAEQEPQFLEEYYPPFDRWFENHVFPGPDGLTIFFHDITERKKLEQKIQGQLGELLRWQEATLGRENRVLELKREVNGLLARAGMPARYPSVGERVAGDETAAAGGGKS